MAELDERLRAIRARVTALTLAPNLPPGVWSELCRLDSDLVVLVVEVRPAMVGDRYRFEYADAPTHDRTLTVTRVVGVDPEHLVFFDDTTHSKQKHLVNVPRVP